MSVKKDFLSLADCTPDEIWQLLDLALLLKREHKSGSTATAGPHARLAGRSLAMVFQKPSLRTRVSFELAMQQLGGHALYLSPAEIRLGVRESIPDAARVLSRYVDAIMARVFAHADVVGLARWATVPVINGLSDYSHPCQGLADLLTIHEHLGRLKGAKLAYVGDGNNMLHSLLLGGALTGMHVVAATPPGYDPLPAVVQHAVALGAITGATIELMRDPQAAVIGADVLYTDAWTSMGQEDEAEVRRRVFPPYQLNAALLAVAGSQAGVLHCLPAHRGEEITDEVADGPQAWIWDQVENRLHAQKAVLVSLLGR